MITAELVKAALGQDRLLLRQVCIQLDLPEADSTGRDQVRKILRDLVKFKQAKVEVVLGLRFYSLCDKSGARGNVQELLWRAMCLKSQKAQPFSVAEAARLAGADRDYAKRYSGFCARQGFIVPVGRRGNARVYRVAPGKEREAAPRWNRRAEKRKARVEGIARIVMEMEAIIQKLASGNGDALALMKELKHCLARLLPEEGGGDGSAKSGDQR